MKHTITIFAILLTWSINAQEYTTPNTGVHWSLEDIHMDSPDTMNMDGAVFTQLYDILVAENDTLSILEDDLTWRIGEEVRVTVAGTFIVNGEVLITAVDPDFPFDGMRLEDGSSVSLSGMTMEFGGGIRVLTEDFAIQNCLLQYNVAGVSTGAVLSFTRGAPFIDNNIFMDNETPAISSGANSGVSGTITSNSILRNNTANSNRPQINMGVTDGENPLEIRYNLIVGNRLHTKVGGIAVSNLIGGSIDAVIEHNRIDDNRYGITVLGNNSSVDINNNIIINNDSEGMPFQGGSGISLTASDSTMNVTAHNNIIEGNLWGITLINTASINLGDNDSNPGQNSFYDNGNGGVTYALYNNTSNTISALHNCWTDGEQSLEAAEEVIFHLNDDDSLGEVLFDPICNPNATNDLESINVNLYPNPSQGQFTIEDINPDFDHLIIRNMDGKIMMERSIDHHTLQLDVNYESGLYILEFRGDESIHLEKMIIGS